MEEEILIKLNAVQCENYTDAQYFKGIPVYKMQVDDIEVYFSECDFQTSEDLREKGLVSFYMKKGKWRNTLLIHKEMLEDYEFIKEHMKNFI